MIVMQKYSRRFASVAAFAAGLVGLGVGQTLLQRHADAQGASVKKREDTHRMADANKAFAHYRW